MKTVLLADDTRCVRLAYGGVLEDHGYRVVLAGDGHEALEMVDRHHVDLAILDVRMPRMGGIEALRRLRGKRPGLPVVLHSSCSEREALADSRERPDAYLRKSGCADELTKVVATLLAKGRGANAEGPRALAPAAGAPR